MNARPAKRAAAGECAALQTGPPRGCAVRVARRAAWAALALFLLLAQGTARVRAQAALLVEEPYGFAGVVNPTGHDAVYFARICAETPVRLRRCAPGELGVVIARYKHIAGYDWLAIPVIPYFYAVEREDEIPGAADAAQVTRLRREYIGAHVVEQVAPAGQGPAGQERTDGDWYRKGNWYELAGAAYDRRIYVFRFNTTPQQDDAFIARMNAAANRSHFNLVFHNCADFAAGVLDFYFPGTFHRRILPDAGITTPRQNAWELERYARRHPGFAVAVDEIPQVPGNRRPSRGDKSVAASLTVTGDVVLVGALIPFAGPYLGGAVCVDFLVWGRYPLPLRPVQMLTPESMAALENPPGTPMRAAGSEAEGLDFSGDR
jgi:hypothetical protein